MENEEKDKVILTGNIPQCPYCKKPTIRQGGGGTRTALYFPPKYNEKGENINPDRNTSTSHWHCNECKNYYVTKGNTHDGYYYINLKPDDSNKVL